LPEETRELSGLLSKNVHEIRSARHGAAPAKNIAVKDPKRESFFCIYIFPFESFFFAPNNLNTKRCARPAAFAKAVQAYAEFAVYEKSERDAMWISCGTRRGGLCLKIRALTPSPKRMA
jgi:hypothetical protein